MAGADIFRHHFCYVVRNTSNADGWEDREPRVDSIWRAHHAAEARAAELNKIEPDNCDPWEAVEVRFGDAGADYSCRSGGGSRSPSPLADLVDPNAKLLTAEEMAKLQDEVEKALHDGETP